MIIAYTNQEDDLKEAASRKDTEYTPGVLSPEILSFFHFVKPQWPSDSFFSDGFPWVEWKFPPDVIFIDAQELDKLGKRVESSNENE